MRLHFFDFNSYHPADTNTRVNRVASIGALELVRSFPMHHILAKRHLATLAAFAKSEKWPKQQFRFLQDFLKDNGISP